MSSNKTIRLRTTPGESQNIQFKIEQEFDTIDFLSLSITQQDAYRNFCSDYGVVAGRVIANDGFGIENAKISIFIPLLNEDVDNQKITSIYPYTTPNDLNLQGIRYNILPNVGRRFWYYQRIPDNLSPGQYLYDPDYTPLGQFVGSWGQAQDVPNPTPGYTVWRRLVETNYGPEVPVGTFPNKSELLDNDVLVEVYEKYYKFTTKTNISGDYMLFGVPVGTQIVHMDVDLSDIGGGSLSPEDFLNTGTPESSFTPTGKFKSSTNLNSLPQIESQDLAVDVVPFWGDLDQCEIGITRQDFTLVREVAPSAVLAFFAFKHKTGYIKANNSKCGSGINSGTISDKDLRSIDNMVAQNTYIKAVASGSGGVDVATQTFPDGLVYYALPMYGGRKITNEFGQLADSPDGLIGIPTEGSYSIYVWGEGYIDSDEDGIGTATHKFDSPMTFRYDLLNKKRLIYTLSTRFEYNKKADDGEPTRLIGSASGIGRLNYPRNSTRNGDPTFGAHYYDVNTSSNSSTFDDKVPAMVFGNLFFPVYEVKGGDICLPAMTSSINDDNVETNWYYASYIFPGSFLDITDVWEKLPPTSFESEYGVNPNDPSFTFEPSGYIDTEYGINISNQTVPLKTEGVQTNPDGSSVDFTDDQQINYVAFPQRLNSTEEPWPRNYFQKVLGSTNKPSGLIFTDSDGNTDMGRYFFYFGFSENDNILKVIEKKY